MLKQQVGLTEYSFTCFEIEKAALQAVLIFVTPASMYFN